jgi:hypothetical protein
MGIPDDDEQFWFNLYGLTALNFLGVTLIPLSRLVTIYDKKGNFCGLNFRLPGWIVIPFYILMHLAFLTPATYIFVDEADSNSSSWYDEANWLIYVVILITILWPHVYSCDWYSLRDWGEHKNSTSYRILVNVANFLYPLMLWCACVLLTIAVVFVALEHEWVSFALYLVYDIFLFLAACYFTVEWWMCRRRYNKERESGTDTMVILMEYDSSVDNTQNVPSTGGLTYGARGYGRKYY